MMDMSIETYCVECDRECTADIAARRETIAIKGEAVEYDAHVAICPICGAEIGDSRVESANLAAAYDEYRRLRSLGERPGVAAPFLEAQEEVRRISGRIRREGGSVSRRDGIDRPRPIAARRA